MPLPLNKTDPVPSAEGILHDYERRYRMMAENIALGIFQITNGENGQVLSGNPVMAAMFGYDRVEDIVGRSINDFFIRSRELEELTTDLRRVGSVAGREIRLMRRDGSEIWVSIRAWNVGMAKDGLMVIEGLAEDITERRVFESEMHYHESELNRYAQALTLANKKLNLLSSITRHDILNKLTGLMGYLELIKEEFPDPQLQEYLTIQSEIIGIMELQIGFTKDYQSLGIENPHWFDLNETIQAAASAIHHPSVTVTVETGDLWIYADPMLEKVFYNLIDNALSHGTNLTRIAFRAEVSGETACIICEDDGGGVPNEFKEAIFNRKHFRHTGFGLFLSREILGITGLGIRETGEPGKGARFEINVPPQYFRIGNAAGA
nr:PAS domain-containing sensor histidine kinase [uncultured Methanoregula sp.]